MAVAVVHALQVIRVDHEHAGCAPVPRGLGEEPVGGEREAAHVQEAGEVVGLRKELGAREAVADVGREHGGDVGDEHHRGELREKGADERQRHELGGLDAAAEHDVAEGDQH